MYREVEHERRQREREREDFRRSQLIVSENPSSRSFCFRFYFLPSNTSVHCLPFVHTLPRFFLRYRFLSSSPRKERKSPPRRIVPQIPITLTSATYVCTGLIIRQGREEPPFF